jgi:hypothetical protein
MITGYYFGLSLKELYAAILKAIRWLMSSLENFLQLPLKNSFSFEVGVNIDQAKLVKQAPARIAEAVVKAR